MIIIVHLNETLTLLLQVISWAVYFPDGKTQVMTKRRDQIMRKRKMKYAGYLLRGLSDLSHLQILEDRVKGKRKCGIKKKMDEGYSSEQG